LGPRLRQLAFSGGAFAFAMSSRSTRTRQPSRLGPTTALAAISAILHRSCIAILWRRASAASGIRAGSSTGKAHS
jgi:hypothetical protein